VVAALGPHDDVPCIFVAAAALKRSRNRFGKVWRHTTLHHLIVTAEALVSHSWFWSTPGRLPTAVVAFSMVPGLLRGPGVHFRVAEMQRRTKVIFVRQSKLATDPLRTVDSNHMSRTAPLVDKVVDHVCVHRAEGIYAVLGRLVRTTRLY
jgi:hypothetical protein